MTTLRILYTSISGNTKEFVESLQAYAAKEHKIDTDLPLIDLTEISDVTPDHEETTPYFAFVPTYLSSSNGIKNGDDELLTEALGEYISYKDNRKFCLGVIGSGDPLYEDQYVLTARQYSEKFGFPVLADYEQGGNDKDVARIYLTLRSAAEKQSK
ncbi:class Ib ribonucleoside-diphosphate reductase assembly flavoprotein NrdI [Loigolactobacillus bifermentans]|uniref:Flavoprotein NrdI n=1 Tax=Loigolactobacillus bifermentans DSM 20003 TaxID=1423726 RepID=A0A0R1GKL4_9LACO|nr:class Ib ribonucleoside-diphosphate reductase assembly flavoprotein NrdI [Loigolactobacillus bifermentans]KRK32449.1 flavoprotein NrdI [Loigolactobacillus bifermentans DSM 20003]